MVERNTRRTQNALIVIDHAGSNPVAGIMEIEDILMRNQALILENEALRLHIEDLKNGFEGCCIACEPVALKNRELVKERDEARREICERVSTTRWKPQFPLMSKTQYAEERGWDCYKEDGK